MFTTILSAFAAIPKLIEAITTLVAWFEKAEAEKWFAQEKKVINQEIPAAESQEDFLKAAKDLQDVTSKI